MVLMASSAWPLLLGFLGELVFMVKIPICCKLGEECIGKLGAIVGIEYLWDAMFCKEFIQAEMVIEALHWDAGIPLMMGILE